MSLDDRVEIEPYLVGPYEPVSDELDVERLEITGSLPPELNGTFLRNGPNPAFAPSGAYHLFDGDGMVHAVRLEGGSASYRNRWIRSAGLEAERRAGRSLYGGMANASFPGPELVGDAGPMKNVANTHVVRHAGRTLCLWEAGPPTELDDELATIGIHDFGGRLPGAMTAHPKVDPVTGEMFAFGYSALPPYLRYHVIDADGLAVMSVDIDLPAPVMMHDFAVTERHAVFLDAPAVFDFRGFAEGGPMLAWQPERGTRLGVMDRYGDGSDLRWFEIDNCYVFHFLNAYDDGSEIVVDACRLARMDIGLDRSAPAGSDRSSDTGGRDRLTRWRIDLDAGSVAGTELSELRGDFPRIDDRRATRRHRHGYLATFAAGRPGPMRGEDGMFDSITAVDLEAGTEVVHRLGAGQSTGEPVFAPAPGERSEQAGWVLSHVHDARDGRSEVLVLDASDIAGAPVARIHMPRRVPFGFHGSWVADPA